MGASPLGVPTGSPGSNANALSQVREAIKILEKALPNLPTGSDPYTAVLSAIQSVSRHVTPSAEVPGVQQTTLRDMQQNAQQSGMLQSVMRSLGGGGGGPPGPAGLPAPSGGPPAPGGAPMSAGV